MNEIIEYYAIRLYGRDCLYIASEHRESINALTGRKTLLESDLEALTALGFKLRQVLPPKLEN